MQNDFQSLMIRCGLYLTKLQMLYEEMDRRYAEAASYYGFECAGCDDNCCYSRFYHHTVLEILYIMKGFRMLSQERQAEIRIRADQSCREMREADGVGKKIRRLCPLNDGVRCMLYSYRPMICRLHGIPHEIRMHGSGVQYGPGCRIFDKIAKDKPYLTFDRTILYSKMAKLEKDVRQFTGLSDKYKMTIAQILLL